MAKIARRLVWVFHGEVILLGMAVTHKRFLCWLWCFSTVMVACRNDVHVTVENASAQSLSKVLLFANSSHLLLGELAPQQEKGRAFSPPRKSSLTIEFSTAAGERRVHRLNNYFSGGDCGELGIVIDAALAPRIQVNNTHLPPCWIEPIGSLLGSEP